jgi:hypothetical protein
LSWIGTGSWASRITDFEYVPRFYSIYRLHLSQNPSGERDDEVVM